MPIPLARRDNLIYIIKLPLRDIRTISIPAYAAIELRV